MRKLGIIAAALLIVTAIVCIGAIAWHKMEFPTYVYRYRLTVEIDANGKTKSGSSVIEVRNQGGWHFPESARFSTHIVGDAVFVDLGESKYVIAILGSGPSGREDYLGGLALEKFGLKWRDEDMKKIQLLEGTRELVGIEIPTLVVFENVNDPRSVQIVRPENLSKMFGEPVRLRAASITLTQEPVTRSIQSKLPWLPHPQYLSGRFGCSPYEAHCLHGGHFTR